MYVHDRCPDSIDNGPVVIRNPTSYFLCSSPVNNSPFVKMMQSEYNLCGIESSVIFRKASLALHVVHQVSSTHVLDHEDQARYRLETDIVRFQTYLHTH